MCCVCECVCMCVSNKTSLLKSMNSELEWCIVYLQLMYVILILVKMVETVALKMMDASRVLVLKDLLEMFAKVRPNKFCILLDG